MTIGKSLVKRERRCSARKAVKTRYLDGPAATCRSVTCFSAGFCNSRRLRRLIQLMAVSLSCQASKSATGWLTSTPADATEAIHRPDGRQNAGTTRCAAVEGCSPVNQTVAVTMVKTACKSVEKPRRCLRLPLPVTLRFHLTACFHFFLALVLAPHFSRITI